MSSVLGKGKLSRRLCNHIKVELLLTLQDTSAVVKDAITRCGWKPVRYCQITVPQGPIQLDGRSCEVTREREMITCEEKTE